MNNRIHEILNEKAKYFTDISDYIWDNPELSYREFKSAKALKDAIVDLGFEFLAHTLVGFGSFQATGAVAAGTLQAFPDGVDNILIFVETDFSHFTPP